MPLAGVIDLPPVVRDHWRGLVLPMPDIAPELLGFVGPVEVPADPPALLLPKPVLGLTPEVAPGVAVGAGGPPIGADKDPPTPCCAVAVVQVAPTNKATSMTNCFLRITRTLFS
jgi:hypothetical protein